MVVIKDWKWYPAVANVIGWEEYLPRDSRSSANVKITISREQELLLVEMEDDDNKHRESDENMKGILLRE